MEQPMRWRIWLTTTLATSTSSASTLSASMLVAAVAAAGAIPPLVRLLGSGNAVVQEGAAGALADLWRNRTSRPGNCQGG